MVEAAGVDELEFRATEKCTFAPSEPKAESCTLNNREPFHSPNYVPGIVLNALPTLTHLISQRFMK